MEKILRLLLLPFSIIYIVGSWLHQKLHDWGVLPQHQFDLPIINIGNLAMGGTGKTPHVLWIADYLNSMAVPTGIVSRGYNRKSKAVLLVNPNSTATIVGDEPLLFYQKLPNTAVAVARQRSQGVDKLLQVYPNTKVIMLDDGLQHWGIVASLPILLTTFARPFFADAVVPAGYLRAKKSDYKKAAIIIVTKCPLDMTLEQKTLFVQKIKPLPHQQLFFTAYQYLDGYEWQTPQLPIPLYTLAQQGILVVTAIADTQYLEDFLATLSATITYKRFPDHYYFTQKDIDEIAKLATNKIILTTEKDATRLQLHADYIQSLGLKIYCLPLQVNFLFGEEELFKQTLKKAIGY